MKTVAGAILTHAAVIAICCGLTLRNSPAGDGMFLCGMAGGVVSLAIFAFGLCTEGPLRNNAGRESD
jgi:hypothetical protein